MRKGVIALGIVASAWLAGPAAAQEQLLPADVGDLSVGKVIEVRDSTGKAVLCAPLDKKPIEGNEYESEAKLVGCGVDTKATGESEVETKKLATGLDQEVELTVMGLPPETNYSIYIDKTLVGTFQTDKSGAAEVELKTASKKAKPKPRRRPGTSCRCSSARVGVSPCGRASEQISTMLTSTSAPAHA